MKRQPSSHLPTAELYGDEFHRGVSYKTWRPDGGGDWLLIYTDGGAGRFATETGSFPTRAGDAVLFAPNDLQDYRTAPEAGKWDLLWTHFMPRPHWEIWLHWPVHENGLRTLRLPEGEIREQFRAALVRMLRLSRRKIPSALDLATNALEEALLWANVTASRASWLTMDIRVRKAADYLTANLRRPFRLDELAAHCGASVSRIAHLFRDQAGTSPQQFLEKHRMQHACQLLRLTSLSVSEVAAECGYSDPFYFSNRFRRNIGRSPLKFRQEWNRSSSPFGSVES